MGDEFTCPVCDSTFDNQGELEERGQNVHQNHDPEEHDDQP
jgi:hypothetical protein